MRIASRVNPKRTAANAFLWRNNLFSILCTILSLLCTIIIINTKADAVKPFPRTIVINLPRHVSRCTNVTRELNSRSIPFAFLRNPVDSRNLTFTHPPTATDDLSYQHNATKMARWFCTPGMIGCFLSHRRCWEECVRIGKPILVFEDDVVLAENTREVVLRALTTLSTGVEDDGDCFDWDVLLLGAIGCVHPLRRRYGLNWIPSLVGGRWRQTRRVAALNLEPNTTTTTTTNNNNKPFTFPPPQIHLPACPYGMHAYLLSPRGASKLLHLCPRASYHVDVVAWGQPSLRLFAVHPLVAWQTNLDTTIGSSSSRNSNNNNNNQSYSAGGGGGGTYGTKGNVPRKRRVLGDTYTGFELLWALNGPLLRVGGPLFGGRMLLTNGTALVIMAMGFVVAWLLGSVWMLGLTVGYVVLVSVMVRWLASNRNS